jgi:hypothetical protein
MEGFRIMALDPIALLIIATILLFFGHVTRAVRWAQLFPPYKLATRFNLLLGLTLGYAVNVILPWRIGEILRAYFVSVRESIDFSYVAATVVVERLSDLLIVAVIMIALDYIFDSPDSMLFNIAAFMIVTALAIIIFVILIRRSLVVRRLIWTVCSIFNDSIRNSIIEFIWNVSEITVSEKILSRNYMMATIIMWSIYASSYFLYGLAVGKVLDETIQDVLGSPLLPIILSSTTDGLKSILYLLLYSILPVIIIIIYGFTRQWSAIIRDFSVKFRFGGSIQSTSLFCARDKFKQENEYDYFLASHFSGDDQVLSSFSLLAMEDGIIVRLFNGGSDAITALIEVNEKLVIRKFALGSAAIKLQEQSDWLKSHNNDNIPLVEIIGDKKGSFFYRYDMPLVASANDFYDVIHTLHVDRSKSLLVSVVEHISAFHQTNEADIAQSKIVEAYLIEKAIKNALKILDFAHDLLPAQDYRINGEHYHLSDWDCLKDINWLTSQVKQLRTSTIHGDLTIENIIVVPEKKPDFYIIDPNPDNIFNTPLIDLSKLMQSLHLGYEGLNRGGQFSSISENAIDLILSRSHAYSALHEHLKEIIVHQYGIDTLREVYFHELINYLRLTPYKIRKDPTMGLTFFACTSILLARYLESQ